MEANKREPLLMLKSFNEYAKRLLMAIQFLDDEKIEHDLLKLTRRTVIAERFFTRRLIAITGLQGQGKSSLIRALFGLPEGYLPTIIGQGEKEPIIVKWEDGISEIECYKYGYLDHYSDIAYVKIEKEELKKIAENGVHDKDALYLEIRVPSHEGNIIQDKEFLLLPGIEKNKKELNWQTNIEYNLEWCVGAIVVTQLEKLADMHSKDFKTTLEDKLLNKYSLVVSCCDGKSQEELNEAKIRGAESFFSDTQCTNNVVCTGIGLNNSFDVGKSDFENMVLSMSLAPKEWKIKNIETIKEIISDGFRGVINSIESKKNEKRITFKYGSEEDKEKALRHFNDTAKQLEKSFDAKLVDALSKYDEYITEKLEKLKQDESFLQRIINIVKGAKNYDTLSKEILKHYNNNDSEEKLNTLIREAIIGSVREATKKRIYQNKKNDQEIDKFFEDLKNGNLPAEKDKFPDKFRFIPVIYFYLLANPDIYRASAGSAANEDTDSQNDISSFFGSIFSGIKNTGSNPSVVGIGGRTIFEKIKKTIPQLQFLDLAEKIISFASSYFKYSNERNRFIDMLKIANNQSLNEYYKNFFCDALTDLKIDTEDGLDEMYGIADKNSNFHELSVALANMERVRDNIKKEIAECQV